VVVERDQPRLGEVGRGEDGRDRERLHRVVARVGHQPVGVRGQLVRDPGRVHVGAAGRGHAEVPRDVLEAEGGQVARAHVVELGEHPGVHDVTAGDVEAAEAERPLRDRQARGPAPDQAAVAAPRQGHAVAPRARLEVLEVEPEDVVALDHVGIALAEQPSALDEQRPLVQPVAAQDVAEAGAVGERDGHDAVALAGRRRKLVALGRDHLDVQGEAAQVAEAEAAERRPPRRDQVLVHGIGEEAVGRLGRVGGEPGELAAAVARAERVAPRAEAREPAQVAAAVEPRERGQPGGAAHERLVGGEQEGREGDGLDAGGGAVADPETHGAPVVGQRGGHEPGRGVGAEQQGRRCSQPAASSTAARYIAASTRPTRARPVSGTITVGIERTPSATAAS
jgi:hypothetical protein